MSSPPHPASESNAPTNASHSAPSSPPTSAGWLVVVGIVTIAAVVFAVLRSMQPSTSEAIGKPAPTIDVIPLTGDAPPIPPAASLPPATSLSASIAKADSFDGITLLHFWGTWCPPCRMEYPELVEMVQEFASDPDFRFISVSCEASVGENTFETLRQQTEDYYISIGVDVPTYCDPAGRTRVATAALLDKPGLYYPSTLLIDRQGKVAQAWEGYTPNGVKQMREAITAHL